MNLEVGKTLQVTCTKLLERGIVVELSDGTTEFIHISNLSDRYIRYTEEIASVGSVYTAYCIAGRARPVELSLVNRNVPKPETENTPARSPKPQKPMPAKKPAPSIDKMIEQSQYAFNDKFSGKPSRRDRRRSNGSKKRNSRNNWK